MYPSSEQISGFRQTVWNYYHNNRRDMPWRHDHSPYFVLVSEIMLQQTQVARVIPKFNEFIRLFPSISTLAEAPLSAVLQAWSGLGYNRRAKYLWQAAQAIVEQYRGNLPAERAQLEALPGIGPNTAGAVLVYAFGQPAVFIETNIRTVYLHYFFPHTQQPVTDRELRALVADTVDAHNPREWYWALMDYGAHLKTTSGGLLQSSRAYRPQSRFAGSRRQLRGMVIRALVNQEKATPAQLAAHIVDERLSAVLEDLISDGLIRRQSGILYLTDH